MDVDFVSLFTIAGVTEVSRIKPSKAIYKFHPSKTNEFIHRVNGGFEFPS